MTIAANLAKFLEHRHVDYEARDREHLVQMDCSDFVGLLRGCKSGRFCSPIPD
jgi:hypothetical protein